MKFVFSGRFYILLAVGLVPLSLSWNVADLQTLVFVYDGVLILAAIGDYYVSRKQPAEIAINRSFDKRFAIGDRSRVTLSIENRTPHEYRLRLKDEFPAEMRLDETREAEFTVDAQTSA